MGQVVGGEPRLAHPIDRTILASIGIQAVSE